MKEIEVPEPKPIVVNQMPTVEQLTDFLRQLNGGEVRVVFDTEKGEFVNLTKKEEDK